MDLALDFLAMTPKTQATKETLDKWNFLKIKIFVLQRHYQKSEKVTHMMGEIFTSHVSDKGQISRIYKKTITTQQ